MGFFGLFGKKKKEAKPAKDMPKPPVPPSTLKPSTGEEIKAPQHVDDLGMGMKEEISPPKGLELPELEFPQLEMPPHEEAEVKTAIESKSSEPKPSAKKAKPDFTPMKFRKEAKKMKEVPEHIPDIEHIPEPEAPKPDVELVTIEEPIELKATPHVKGPVFIRSDQFKIIKDNVNGLRDSLGKAEETLNNVIEIKNREDSEYEGWHTSAEAIQRKLLYVDKMLFE